jgi:hypothetical protein
MARFEAERFCSRMGLIFGLPQSNMAQFLPLSSGEHLSSSYTALTNKFTTADNTIFWDQSLTYQNTSLTEKRAICMSIVK